VWVIVTLQRVSELQRVFVTAVRTAVIVKRKINAIRRKQAARRNLDLFAAHARAVVASRRVLRRGMMRRVTVNRYLRVLVRRAALVVVLRQKVQQWKIGKALQLRRCLK
jgi:hypothetical protein